MITCLRQAGCKLFTELEAIDDHFEKVVVSLDEITMPLRGGIRHIQAWKLYDILLADQSEYLWTRHKY
jgi:hypothetical protein